VALLGAMAVPAATTERQVTALKIVRRMEIPFLW
jgi:hypothetical protein